MTTGAIGFGPGTHDVAARLQGIDVIVSSLPIPPEAYVAAVDRRIAGTPSYGMILWDDLRARVAFDLAPSLLRSTGNQDERRTMFDQLAQGRLIINSTPCSELARLEPEIAMVAREFSRLCSGMLVWSHAQAESFAQLFARRPPAVERVCIPHDVPEFIPQRGEGLSVVIWAPEVPPDQTALLAFALHELHASVFVICADGSELPDVRAEYVRRNDPRVPNLLARASCIVPAALSDPGAALAFSQYEVPLAVSLTSGAHELIAGARPFEPWSWHSILRAVTGVAGQPASPAASILPQPLRISATDWATVHEPPVATILIPTFNRLEILRGCLEFHSKQTYPALEILVVNDGGESPAEIVKQFPRARLLDRTENIGADAVIRVALPEARGKYCCICPDDDHLYPDFIERHVDILERTGAMIAHGNALIRYQELGDDGAYHDFAYNASVYVQTIDPGMALAFTSMINSTWFARREVYEMLAKLDRSSQYVEFLDQLAVLDRHDFIHVDHITSDWIMRKNWGIWRKASIGNPEAMQALYEQFPATGRPTVEHVRRLVVESLREQQGGREFLIEPSVRLRSPRPERAT
jgi:hypothetical protein